MGGCQINFTVSCFIRGKRTDLELKVAFSSPPPFLPGWYRLHRLQWRPFLPGLPALPEPNRGQRVPDSTVECGQRDSGLWFVSNLFSCPPSSLQMFQPLGSQSPLCLFSNSLSSHRDKLFPAFGFGAQVPPDWQVSTPPQLLYFQCQGPDLGGWRRFAVWHPALCGDAGMYPYRHMHNKYSGLNSSYTICLAYTIMSCFFTQIWPWRKNLIFILAFRSPMNLPWTSTPITPTAQVSSSNLQHKADLSTPRGPSLCRQGSMG